MRQLLEQSRLQKSRRDAATEKAEDLREIATTVFDRMAELPGIAERAGRFAVSVGRLYIKDERGNLHDFETRQSTLEKDFDGLVDTIRRELDSLKQTTMVSLSKKADFSLVDTLRDSLQRKVDTETLATTASGTATWPWSWPLAPHSSK